MTIVVSEQSQIKVDPMRELVSQAALSPAGRRWQVFVIEDADRLNDKAADALLKSIEEPPPRTVWLLCAPTVEDVLPTIRSRCRAMVLRTPPPAAVAPTWWLATERRRRSPPTRRGRRRGTSAGLGRLALHEPTRIRRREVLRIPTQLLDLGSCMTCAANLLEAATEEGEPRAAALDAADVTDLEAAYGAGSAGGQERGLRRRR